MGFYITTKIADDDDKFGSFHINFKNILNRFHSGEVMLLRQKPNRNSIQQTKKKKQKEN